MVRFGDMRGSRRCHLNTFVNFPIEYCFVFIEMHNILTKPFFCLVVVILFRDVKEIVSDIHLCYLEERNFWEEREKALINNKWNQHYGSD